MIDTGAFREVRDQIVDIIDGNSAYDPESVFQEDIYRELDFYIHPGFGEYTDVVDKTLNLERSDYREHKENIHDRLENSSENPVAILYPEKLQDETEEFIEDSITGGSVYIPTFYDDSGILSGFCSSSRPVNSSDENGSFNGAARLAGVLDSVEENGTVNISGELYTQCYENASWLLEEISKKSSRNFDVERQVSFPEGVIVPLPFRNIHLEEDQPIEKIYTGIEEGLQRAYRPE